MLCLFNTSTMCTSCTISFEVLTGISRHVGLPATNSAQKAPCVDGHALSQCQHLSSERYSPRRNMLRRTSSFTHLIVTYKFLLPQIIQNRLQKPASVYIKPKNNCVAALLLLIDFIILQLLQQSFQPVLKASYL